MVQVEQLVKCVCLPVSDLQHRYLACWFTVTHSLKVNVAGQSLWVQVETSGMADRGTAIAKNK